MPEYYQMNVPARGLRNGDVIGARGSVPQTGTVSELDVKTKYTYFRANEDGAMQRVPNNASFTIFRLGLTEAERRAELLVDSLMSMDYERRRMETRVAELSAAISKHMSENDFLPMGLVERQITARIARGLWRDVENAHKRAINKVIETLRDGADLSDALRRAADDERPEIDVSRIGAARAVRDNAVDHIVRSGGGCRLSTSSSANYADTVAVSATLNWCNEIDMIVRGFDG